MQLYCLNLSGERTCLSMHAHPANWYIYNIYIMPSFFVFLFRLFFQGRTEERVESKEKPTCSRVNRNAYTRAAIIYRCMQIYIIYMYKYIYNIYIYIIYLHHLHIISMLHQAKGRQAPDRCCHYRGATATTVSVRALEVIKEEPLLCPDASPNRQFYSLLSCPRYPLGEEKSQL